jgi:serine phosphatase RsbU (regulator of sigma subunit)
VRTDLLPSGRLTILRILMRQILAAPNHRGAIVVSEDPHVVRIPGQLRRQIRLSLVEPPLTYEGAIADAVRHHPGLLVVDRIDAENVVSALEAAQDGLLVLAQLDTIYRGADVARHLLDLGAPQTLLGNVSWVVSVRRRPTLCPYCKEPEHPDRAQLEVFNRRYPSLQDVLANGAFFRANGCAHCGHTGRQGDVTVFDIFVAGADATSCLPLEAYVVGLAALGHLPLDDVFRLEAEQLRHTYQMLTSSERALAEISSELQRRLAELEAANQVLKARTEALISLHDIGQALISSRSLDDLGLRVCRHTHDLCGADRAILYFQRPNGMVEVLAVNGWDRGLIHQRFDHQLIFNPTEQAEPMAYPGWPPGIPARHPDVEGAVLRAGLRVPLIAQGERVGLMIVHTTYKTGFTPGEVAMLQTFANQAALAIQRAGLIEQLQDKIAQLEAAQAELVEKERLEREMELARQVQQSVIPRIFPMVPGYRFGACNQPARRVGGDFYDVILLDGNHFGLVIADVSDKGMPAALYMALTRSLILAEARRDRSPRAVLRNVHRLLLELGEPDMFVTVFYGVVDGPSRTLTYVRAGHDRPILLHNGGVQQLGGEGTLLGFPDLDDLHLSEEQITLAPGDRLALYTDGLIDLLSPQGRSFGLGRLKELLQSCASLSPDEVCSITFAELMSYQGSAEQYDDMTMLVVAVQ